MAILGPYIIQYSTLMYSFHRKNYFKEEVFNNFSCIRKFYLVLSLTAFGMVLMPILDIWLKIFSAIRVFCLLLICKTKSKKKYGWIAQDTIEKRFENMVNCNAYELDSYERQKKYTQVIFEDLLMLILQLLIYTSVLDVPHLHDFAQSGRIVFYSFVMTLVSIFSTAFTLWIESKELHEGFIEYIMFSLNAKQDWVSYGQGLLKGEITKDINFGLIELKIPMLTDATGLYLSMDYMFSEDTLLQLEHILEFTFLSHKQKACSHKIMSASGQHHHPPDLADLPFEPVLKFGYSVQSITAHVFLTFINRCYTRDAEFVLKHLDLNDIDWDRMIEITRLKYSDRKDSDLRRPVTISGKPLLQVCIENENEEDGSWQLKRLTKLLLHQPEFDPNSYDME